MRFDKKLDFEIAVEEVATTRDELDIRPNHKAIFDAIKQFLDMDIGTLYDFATSGGYIEEDIIIINGFPKGLLAEQVIRTVYSGNYTKILEISFGSQPQYRGYVVVKLNIPDERINNEINRKLANWNPNSMVPFLYYKTEKEALKAMGTMEDDLASKAPVPVMPPPKKSLKTHPSPSSNVKKVAIQLAHKMGRPELDKIIQNMSREEIITTAAIGKKAWEPDDRTDKWEMVKYIFLGWLALSSLVTGAAGIAATIIGYFLIRALESTKK